MNNANTSTYTHHDKVIGADDKAGRTRTVQWTAERFLFPVLIRGTNYRKKSPLSTFQRHLKTLLFRKSFPDIIVDLHFSGPCGNLNLGHSKNSDW